MKYVTGFLFALLAFVMLVFLANLTNEAITNLIRDFFPPKAKAHEEAQGPSPKYKHGDCVTHTYKNEFDDTIYIYYIDKVGITQYRMRDYLPDFHRYGVLYLDDDIKRVDAWDQIKCPEVESR